MFLCVSTGCFNMKTIFLSTLILFLAFPARSALYIIVVGQQPPPLTNLCPGDTIRFSGDSLNGWVYGTIAGMVMNADSTLDEFFSVSSDSNVATHWDHVLLPGDLGYYFATIPPESGTFVFNCTSGISIESEPASFVHIYPNPASTQVEISSRMQIQHLKLYDCFGKLIIDRPVNAEKDFLDISCLANGTYLLEIKTHSGLIYKRLIRN